MLRQLRPIRWNECRYMLRLSIARAIASNIRTVLQLLEQNQFIRDRTVRPMSGLGGEFNNVQLSSRGAANLSMFARNGSLLCPAGAALRYCEAAVGMGGGLSPKWVAGHQPSSGSGTHSRRCAVAGPTHEVVAMRPSEPQDSPNTRRR